jgi:hypothetical protein
VQVAIAVVGAVATVRLFIKNFSCHELALFTGV